MTRWTASSLSFPHVEKNAKQPSSERANLTVIMNWSNLLRAATLWLHRLVGLVHSSVPTHLCYVLCILPHGLLTKRDTADRLINYLWLDRELTLNCKLKRYVQPMKNPLGVSPCNGNQGTICVHSATQHNIHMYPYFLFAAIHHLNRPRDFLCPTS